MHLRKFLISATDGGKSLVSSSGRFTLGEWSPQYAMNRSQGGYRNGLDAVDNKKLSSYCTESNLNPAVIQPV